MFVTDLIGNDYKNWMAGDKIIIASPTGSGKSTFILRSLLPHAMKQGQHIVYICNRKVLNDQFTVESRKQIESILETTELTEDEVHSIHVTTYQHCETANSFPYFTIPPDLSGMSREEYIEAEICNKLPKPKSLPPEEVLYCVFDEAHYFLSDAMFNPNTNYWVGKDFSRMISIFLTATPDLLLCFLACQICSLYDEIRIVRQISDRFIERNKLKKRLSKKQILWGWDEESRAHYAKEIVFTKQDEIQRQCREIAPYELAFQFIDKALSRNTINLMGVHMNMQSIDYSYVYTKYFNKFYDLIDSIVASTDKWLIFISNENDGIDLAARLSEKEISVAYLSAQTRHKKGSNGYREFHNIVEHQTFECRVLIATSVMDCGVSVKDPKLKHIVIDQSDKTEFLQMLGRRRVGPNEIIHLYIKYLSPKNIDSMRARDEKALHFMVNFYRINEVGYDRKRTPTAVNDGMQGRSELPANTINRTVKELMDRNHPTLVYNKNPATHPDFPTTGPYSNPVYNKSSSDFLKEYRMSTTAFIQILYTLKGYMAALEVYRTEQDPLFYLKEQLSWLGKSYDVQNWVGYTERMQELSDFLEGYRSSASKITANQQPIFRQECLDHILSLPMPIKTIRKDISRFKNGTVPGMKKLNDVFREIGLPYRIKSKQAASGDRKTVWYVK